MEKRVRTLKEIEDQIILMLKPIVSRNKTPSAESEIYKDLNLRGDDAEDFILAIADTFEVDLDDFEVEKYFPNEFAAITDWPFKSLGLSSKLDHEHYSSITVQELSKTVFHKLQQNRK
jgi:Protein of unknown function (DUF1493)